MRIDAHTGSITLPSGFILHSALKVEDFRSSGLCEAGNVYNPGTPWYYHRFSDGDFEKYPLGFVVCFYENQNSLESALVRCSFMASSSFDPAKFTGWGNWSLEEESLKLELNRRLLEKLFGKPHRFQKNMSSWDEFPIFKSHAFYEFEWGQVWCGSEDIKTNIVDAGIGLRYFINEQWAHDNYEQYRKPSQNKLLWKEWLDEKFGSQKR